MGASTAIFAAVISVLENAPGLEAGRREVIELGKRLWDLMVTEAEPTEDQLRQYAAAFEAARSSLENE
jgi:hypothetical protein